MTERSTAIDSIESISWCGNTVYQLSDKWTVLRHAIFPKTIDTMIFTLLIWFEIA